MSLLVACGSADFTGSSTPGPRTKASQNGGGGSLTGSGAKGGSGSSGAADAADGDATGSEDGSGANGKDGSGSDGSGSDGSGSDGSGGSTSRGGSTSNGGLGSDGSLDQGEIDGGDGDGGGAEEGSGSGSASGSASPGEGSDGTITGDRAKLSIKGLRQDDDDVTLTIVTDDGKTATLTWPKEGEQVDLEGLCSKPNVVLKVSTVRDGQTYLPTNPQCFVGKTIDTRSVAIGFEDDCNSLDYNKVDEEIGVFSCPGSTVTVESLRLDPAIDMGEWID